ncbi:MAG: bifunctional phosphoribosylaminoimidazolecarboxamide formyltransferase/IMP cyclohydrolase [Balneolaceae bacterium]
MALQPLDHLPTTPLKIKRALLSVSDKTGLIPFARKLSGLGIELISTGGTARAMREAGIEVRDVSEITGFPECLDGRVKTLHPAIHGGILARTSHEPDISELNRLNIRPFELVVVNLYPFRKTVDSPDITPEVATENIDIGGPAMIRAAAKNFAHVCVVSSPSQYESLAEELQEQGEISFDQRRQLAKQAFNHTADYDAAISTYFGKITGEGLPEQWTVSLPKAGGLRYGENPHQPAAVYGSQDDWFNCFHGKALSYNNYLDIDSALSLISDFQDSDPTAAIFKHTVPCGVASDPESMAGAWHKAFSTDTVSPFGGIVIVNRKLDRDTASEIDAIFTEIIMAPSFSREALDLLTRKKNRRLVEIKKFHPMASAVQFRSIAGGALLQNSDRIEIDAGRFKTVTGRSAGEEEMDDLLFAWKVVRHVKSNAIVYAKNSRTLGIGTGQPSRVDSSEIAIRKAQKESLSLADSVVASDAFFPFADGVEAAADAGVRAIIQPGGSIRDQEVIDAADKRNIAMVFTGSRHFKH